MRMLGIGVIRLKRRIKGKHLTLRLLRIRDLFTLCSIFRPEFFSDIGGAAIKFFGSPFSLWRWLRCTFHVFYMIERKRTSEHSIMGFIGLYDLDIGMRASLSVVLFDPRDRRQGYGREAVYLLMEFLEKAGLTKRIDVEVLKDNLASLMFLTKMGFTIQTEHGDYFLMAKEHDKVQTTQQVKGA